MSDLSSDKHILAIQSILKTVGERVEGNLVCDITPDNFIINAMFPKIKNLQHICKDKENICEIGINACHSLLLMLMINPRATYLLFDLNNHKYTEPCLNYIKEQFPETKITAIFGNSVETVSKYINEHPESHGIYDLCHIDGGHTEDIFSHDFINIKKLSKNDSPVLFDDYNMSDIKRYIDKKVYSKDIIPLNQILPFNTTLHFLYKYNHTL